MTWNLFEVVKVTLLNCRRNYTYLQYENFATTIMQNCKKVNVKFDADELMTIIEALLASYNLYKTNQYGVYVWYKTAKQVSEFERLTLHDIYMLADADMQACIEVQPTDDLIGKKPAAPIFIIAMHNQVLCHPGLVIDYSKPLTKDNIELCKNYEYNTIAIRRNL